MKEELMSTTCPTCGHEAIPDEPAEGVVVIDRDGDAWQRRDTGNWNCTEEGSDLRNASWTALYEEYGPMTVVYTP